jgi:histidinol-phosphate aminotransferase
MILPKPIKLQVERYIGGLSQLKKIDNPIKLSANESALGPSPKAIMAFENYKDKIFKYPESDSNSLREVLSKKFNINPKRIICGSGSDQIFDLTCRLFLEPGDEVIVTEFGFVMYRIYASLHKAKIVFIANPNNPTGTYLTKNEMLNLREKLRSDILMVVDDAYFEFLNISDFTSGLDLFKDSANVLITRTFSKIYGLAGLRLGWGYSSKEIIDAMYQIKPPFNVNRAALAAGAEAIKDSGWTKSAIEHNTLWSKKIYSFLKEYNIKTNEPTANFFLMNFDETKINSDEIFEQLTTKRLILRKMIQYKISNALRLTIGNKEANEHFIKSMESILK